jgi:tape measure domain-containing protein
VAEQLGEARLKLSVDDTALNAGLQRAQQQAGRTGQTINQAFTGSTRSIAGLEARLESLRGKFKAAEIGSKEFRKLQAEIRKTEQELSKVDQTLGSTFKQRAGGFGGGLLGALGVGAGIGAGAAVGGFIKSSIDQAVELENITRKLSNTLGQQGAGAALNFTSGLAKDLGLNFKELSNAFASFTAAATAANVPLETQKDLFAAVSKAGQALGLSNDEINGSLLALQQVASKGTVSMEELRGQLGERLPIALSAAAKGLGLNQQQLIKLVESGKLTADQFFPALTKGLNDLTAGAEGLETTAQKFQKFQNAWQDLQTSFGTNLLPGITATVGELTKAIEGLGVASEAKRLGFSTGFLNGVSTQGAQAVGALRAAQRQFNLNDAQAKTVFDQALEASGAGRGALTFGFNDKEYLVLLDQILVKAKELRAANPDKQAALQAAAAADQKLKQAQAAAEQVRAKQLDSDLTQGKSNLELQNILDRIAATKELLQLDDAGRAKIENRLALTEKLRATEALRLDLAREQDKPKGTGDGQNGTQSLAKVAELQNQIKRSEAETALLRVQQEQAEAQSLRTQQEKVRQSRLDAVNAADKLKVTQQLTALELRTPANQQVSATAKLQLQQQLEITQKLRQEEAARAALATELARPKGQQDRVVVGELQDRVRKANQDVVQAYADAGLSLVQNAKTAAEALKDANKSLDSFKRSNFEVLTFEEQQQQLEQARQELQIGVDKGYIREGLPIGTPEQIFRLAGIANQREELEVRKQQATIEKTLADNALELGVKVDQFIGELQPLRDVISANASATQALAEKDWLVNVSVNGAPAPAPVL